NEETFDDDNNNKPCQDIQQFIMSSLTFKVVTIAGATGRLGFHIADAFLNDGSYNIKVLRQKPKSENNNVSLLVFKGAKIIYVDYNDKNDLVKTLKGTDVVICAIGGHEFLAPQCALFVAAKEVGDGIHCYYWWIIGGLFHEYLHILGLDYKNKKAKFYVDGNTKVACTALLNIGKYIVESLKLPEAHNGTIRVAGSILTLKELLQKYEEITSPKWEVFYDLTLRERYKNNIDPIPMMLDDFAAYLVKTLDLKNINNDKFSFTPRPVTETISTL
ncbi:9248_t:CDS:2, partial [Cetraspora pellucida]